MNFNELFGPQAKKEEEMKMCIRGDHMRIIMQRGWGF